MSTRYVWAIWNTETKYAEKIWKTGSSFGGALYSINARTFAYGSSYNFDEDDGKYSIIGATERNAYTYNGDSFDFSVPANCYFLLSERHLNQGNGAPLMYKTRFATSVHIAKQSGGVRPEITTGQDVTAYSRDYTYIKGQSITGYASSANSGQYPDDALSRNVWYTKQGSDNIDPSACSIPSTIMGGTQIQITVTPGTGKVYAGTVSYIYQVKLGSGNWTTIATTTATTRTYTVPYGTESIQVRVQAKDDIGFTSSDYATSSAVTVINNQPPTAPGSIEVTNVVSGQQCTITITAATDPDGTVESYIYERSVDGSAWEQIANVNALTYNDTINAEWGTVAYRAKAVDDDGDSGPYVTSQTSVVNSGWVIISGPSNDMGDKPAPFEFELSVSISGQETSDNITVDVTLDGKSVYSQAVAPNTPISIDVDTRTMRTGSHSFAVAATCDTYVPASGEYTFNVPEITIPDGGRMDQLEGQDGNVIFPITLARAVAGLENYGVESKVHPGAYTGTGTYGTDNPNTLEFEFEPKMVLIQGTAGRVAILIKPSGVGVSIGPNESTTLNVTWQGKTVSWYNALNAANQMNTENETYSYTAFG